ncbi:hypothetical protein TcasGA2_TC034753 [Tribolium castaneum]|uniref:Uncharacterized protein n=1 Tax=Tribolium castaneum TaxID=7070 RepID=A0A139WG10_TRICA|nr:hypothetical protein TcasGA2_TC034753 [Tribolium castaneum]
MHFYWLSIFCALVLCTVQCASIEEPFNYGPKITPTNIPSARQALGYDKYERQPVESSKSTERRTYPHGNNWEDFGTPEIHYNFGYNG